MDTVIGAGVLLAIVGATRLIDLISDKDYESAAKVIVAVIIGGVAGYFNVQGLDLLTGIGLGFSAAGGVTLADRI